MSLQGATLNFAQLQGATLVGAQLQGASLNRAQLQGADLTAADLEGASLFRAQLQGASLNLAQLQGAILLGADLEGTSLERAMVWRAQLRASSPKNLLYNTLYWNAVSSENGMVMGVWTDTAYTGLRQSIEHTIPMGGHRSNALQQVSILDCAETTWRRENAPLASCDPSARPPEILEDIKRSLGDARVDQSRYAAVLVNILGDLVCSNEPDRLDVLRGLLRSKRLAATGSEMHVLAIRIASAECPVSKELTDSDKAGIAKTLPELRQR